MKRLLGQDVALHCAWSSHTHRTCPSFSPSQLAANSLTSFPKLSVERCAGIRRFLTCFQRHQFVLSTQLHPFRCHYQSHLGTRHRQALRHPRHRPRKEAHR